MTDESLSKIPLYSFFYNDVKGQVIKNSVFFGKCSTSNFVLLKMKCYNIYYNNSTFYY